MLKKNMSVITPDLRQIVSFKIKKRGDSLTDQFSRIFMPKLILLCSMLMGLNYYNDKIWCIVQQPSRLSEDFVQSTCWIVGFYVYEQMHDRWEESGYYGIPRNLDYNGINEKGELCTVVDRNGLVKKDCIQMTKRYFNHYQWMPFYIASLSIAYYIPYVLFKITNRDIALLKRVIDEWSATEIVKRYFSVKAKGKFAICGCIVTKLLYVTANVGTFLTTDNALDKRFLTYGLTWARWHFESNQTSTKNSPTPGNYLLPPWGFCDLHEAVKDTRLTFVNRHNFICEVSTNVIYQYIFIILWFFFVMGCAISGIGLLVSLISYTRRLILSHRFRQKCPYNRFSLRQLEYLDIIEKRNLSKHAEVVNILRNTNGYRSNDKSANFVYYF